ncbi:MAG: hypothetical protein EOO01_28475 [Chitinophagaceae bacterium]|nr:MAG: hypothetical protein EOO01_28475 [Chitinophagaceae bacterium]
MPLPTAAKGSLVNNTFFLSWLALTIAGVFWKSEAKLTRNYLYAGGILSLGIPLANGFTTDDWFWKTLGNKQYLIAGTDLFWLVTGILCVTLALKFWQKPKADFALFKFLL